MRKLALFVTGLMLSTGAFAFDLGDKVKATLIDHVGPVVQFADGESRGAIVDSVIRIGNHNGDSVLDLQGGYSGVLDKEDGGSLIGGGFLKVSSFLDGDLVFPDHWKFLQAVEHGPVWFYNFDDKRDYLGYQVGLSFELNPKN